MEAQPTLVLVVGGSLVGLSAAVFLAWRGVPTVLVERHPGSSPHPRAIGFTLRGRWSSSARSGWVRASRRCRPRFRSERDFWRFADAHLRQYFPNLLSHGQLNRRIRTLEPDLGAFQRDLAAMLVDGS